MTKRTRTTPPPVVSAYRSPAEQLSAVVTARIEQDARRTSAVSASIESARIASAGVDALKKRIDDWVNTMTGLGDATYDKRLAMEVTDLGRQPMQVLEWLYHNDDIAATMVDRIVEDALRGGVTVPIYKEDGAQDEEAMRRTSDAIAALRLIEGITEGLIFGRLKGGAIDVLGLDDGLAPEKPLNDKGIKSFRFQHVVDAQSLTIERSYAKVLEQKYGDPELYLVQPESIAGAKDSAPADRQASRVHETRTLRFRGARTSRNRRAQNAGWDDSVLRRPWEIIRDFASVWGNAALALHDTSRPVLKIPRLFELMGDATGSALLEARVKAAQLLSSMTRFMVIDTAEELDRDGPDLAGYPDMLDRFMLRLAAAARMPVTILMGRSPAGLNATGESDLQSWYDTVRAYQRDQVRPVLERALKMLFLAKDGPTKGTEPKRWEIHFPPLGQPSMKEQAEIQLAVAQADAIYIDRDALRPEEAVVSHMRPEGFSTGYIVDLDKRRKALLEEPDDDAADPDAEEDPPEPPDDEPPEPEPEE